MQIKGSNRISKIVTSSNSPPPPSTVTQPKLFLFCRLAFIALPKKKNPKKQQLQAENLPPTLRLYSKPFYTLCSVWTWVWVSAWPVSVCVGVCVCVASAWRLDVTVRWMCSMLWCPTLSMWWTACGVWTQRDNGTVNQPNTGWILLRGKLRRSVWSWTRVNGGVSSQFDYESLHQWGVKGKDYVTKIWPKNQDPIVTRWCLDVKQQMIDYRLTKELFT